jgi:erythromycin esterase-like protein
VGFYGLDLYSLRASMKAVLQVLETIDPEAAKKARERYACFDRFGEDPQIYGLIAATGATKSCQDEAVRQLVELERRAASNSQTRPGSSEEDLFNAEQNARVVKNAEAYYRSMFLEDVSSWNLRDTHMMETLEFVREHLNRHRGDARIAVWEHNSHLGDARATQMGVRGELNVGQLTREKYGSDAVLVGFTTHHGTVTSVGLGLASRAKARAPGARRELRKALPRGPVWELPAHAAR